MAYSYSTSVGDAVTTVFAFTFTGLDKGYINKSDVQVELVDEQGVWTKVPYNTGWIFETTNSIRFLQAAPPVNNVFPHNIRIRRIMDKNSPYADWSVGQNFDEQTLDNSFLKLLYIEHELLDGFGMLDATGNIDMHNYRIINLADGINVNDAVNKKQLDLVESIQNSWNTTQDSRLTVLEQSASSNSRFITWDSQADTDGITELTPPYTFINARLYHNGVKQVQGKAYSVLNNKILLAEPSVAKDWYQLELGTEPSDFIATDISNHWVTAKGTSTARTLADRFADSINVKDFGATGKQDQDFSAIWDAILAHVCPSFSNEMTDAEIDSLIQGTEQRTIIFPCGKYRLTKTMFIPANIKIVGLGTTGLWTYNKTNTQENFNTANMSILLNDSYVNADLAVSGCVFKKNTTTNNWELITQWDELSTIDASNYKRMSANVTIRDICIQCINGVTKLGLKLFGNVSGYYENIVIGSSDRANTFKAGTLMTDSFVSHITNLKMITNLQGFIGIDGIGAGHVTGLYCHRAGGNGNSGGSSHLYYDGHLMDFGSTDTEINKCTVATVLPSYFPVAGFVTENFDIHLVCKGTVNITDWYPESSGGRCKHGALLLGNDATLNVAGDALLPNPDPRVWLNCSVFGFEGVTSNKCIVNVLGGLWDSGYRLDYYITPASSNFTEIKLGYCPSNQLSYGMFEHPENVTIESHPLVNPIITVDRTNGKVQNTGLLTQHPTANMERAILYANMFNTEDAVTIQSVDSTAKFDFPTFIDCPSILFDLYTKDVTCSSPIKIGTKCKSVQMRANKVTTYTDHMFTYYYSGHVQLVVQTATEFYCTPNQAKGILKSQYKGLATVTACLLGDFSSVTSAFNGGSEGALFVLLHDKQATAPTTLTDDANTTSIVQG